MPSGWHTYEVTVDDEINGKKYHATVSKEEFFLPYQTSYGIISDIDDTFSDISQQAIIPEAFCLTVKKCTGP
jgi:phosphatidate phosphatase APP1